MNLIPKLGRPAPGWFQPSQRLFTWTEDGFAVMYPETWESMRTEDQAGLQSINPGLMWRRQEGETRYLCWYNIQGKRQCVEVLDKRVVDLISPPAPSTITMDADVFEVRDASGAVLVRIGGK